MMIARTIDAITALCHISQPIRISSIQKGLQCSKGKDRCDLEFAVGSHMKTPYLCGNRILVSPLGGHRAEASLINVTYHRKRHDDDHNINDTVRNHERYLKVETQALLHRSIRPPCSRISSAGEQSCQEKGSAPGGYQDDHSGGNDSKLAIDSAAIEDSSEEDDEA